MSFSFVCFPAAYLLLCFILVVMRRVSPVHGAMVPDDVASAHVAVDPFLLSALFAMDSSEAFLILQLFFFGFLFSPASGACKKSAMIFDLFHKLLSMCFPCAAHYLLL